jgi:hypothetical protein
MGNFTPIASSLKMLEHLELTMSKLKTQVTLKRPR